MNNCCEFAIFRGCATATLNENAVIGTIKATNNIPKNGSNPQEPNQRLEHKF
ncbi:MAG: hypothetical protein OEM28_06060 [Nitrosopumilus sp.]|nr:hypothetical protein [Nitrosopumilus sp.]MDH3487503.1 hypothetical protein [Nitrosopumilus sp.]